MSKVKLICADAFKRLPTMPAGSVDCVVTSPPYWNLKDYNGEGNLYGNERTLAEYRATTRMLCRELNRVVKDTGSAWINIGYKRCPRTWRLLNIPALWAEDAEAEGLLLRQLIVWDKNHTAPNGPTNRERDTHEIILHLTKKGSGYHYEMARAPYKNATQATAKSQHKKVHRWVARREMTFEQGQKAHAEIDRRTKAGECNRIRGPNDKDMHAHSVVGCAPDSRARAKKRDGFCFDNWNEDGAVGGNVWRIGRGGASADHPCTFPVKLAWECIRRTCPKTGVVLDPFMGSGSTAVAAMRLGIRCIGIEIMREHVETTKRRLKEGK